MRRLFLLGEPEGGWFPMWSRVLFVGLGLLWFLLTGCGVGTMAPAVPVAGATIKGAVHGGQQPVSGAHVYLYAANTAGYNTTAATYGSVSLLQATTSTVPTVGATTKDGNGNYYVTSAADGSFSITGDYTCTPDSGSVPGQQVYLYITGGNTGGGTNASLGMMAVLGDCPAADSFAASVPYVGVNEVSTVAAAYAMAGFAWDATHVSSSSTTLAKVGVKNAFANAANLATLSTGAALATTPAGNGTAPQAAINTLANILAACVNTNGAVTGPTSPTACYTLFYNAKNGTTVPGDTATAAINIAHNPGANVATLYGLSTGTPPFGAALGSQPNDFTIGINFTGGGLNFGSLSYEGVNPNIAIDSSGNAWIVDHGSSAISEFSSMGSPTSSTGYTGGGLKNPVSIAIDGSGYLWVTTSVGLSKFSSAGNAVASSPYTGGGYGEPGYLAIDGSGNVWVTYSTSSVVDKLSSAGSVVAETDGGYYAGLSYPGPIAIDGSGDAWVTFQGQNGSPSVGKLTNSGTYVSGVNGYQGGGLEADTVAIAMDSSGDSWINNYENVISQFSNSGSAISPSSGYKYSYVASLGIAIDGAGNVWLANPSNSLDEISKSNPLSYPNVYTGGVLNAPSGVAVDGSGDVWIGNSGNSSVTEFIGVATPVITPICAGLPSTPTSNGTSNLGTRP